MDTVAEPALVRRNHLAVRRQALATATAIGRVKVMKYEAIHLHVQSRL